MNHQTCSVRYLDNLLTGQRYVEMSEVFVALLTEWLAAQGTVLEWQALPLPWEGSVMADYHALHAVVEQLGQAVGYPMQPGMPVLPLLTRVLDRLVEQQDAPRRTSTP